MAEIKYYDENDLQRKIKDILNHKGFQFEIVPHKYDLVDKVRKIYIEVKTEKFAPAQILYAIAQNNQRDISYIGLACAFEVRFYKPPPFKSILKFAKEIDPDLSIPPSAVDKAELHEKAFELLGNHWKIYTYKGDLNLDEPTSLIFVDEENYPYFKKIFEKYEIDPSRFLPYIADIYAKNHEIKVNNDGWIINVNTGEFFRNTDKEQRSLWNDYNYKPIKNFRDKTLIESIRIRGNDIQNILHQIDRMEPIESRRFRGRFFTKDKVQDTVIDIVNELDPDYIVEPYVGAGSLIDSFVEKYSGVANDINKGFIDVLRKKYEGLNWIFTSVNTIEKSTDELIRMWKIPKNKKVLILTNPPFGTTATSLLVSKKGEISKNKKSRKIAIDYGGLGDKYGRGDLCIPAIAKLIEIIKRIKKGYIATFSPAGVLMGRLRYKKLLKALLKDFKFIEGYIFSGENFNSVSSKKPIAFTVWEYSPRCDTNIESLKFYSEGKLIRLKPSKLLKDHWKYNTARYIRGEIAVQRADYFNIPTPKMFHLDVKKGGSELIPENVKIDLNIPNIPSELIYGLWSTIVSYRSITEHPIYMDNAYIHLPDFNRVETMEILAYAVIYNLISELKNNYCKGKIGFVGMKRVFKFGGKELTDGAKYLIEKYGYIPIGNKTLKDVFEELRSQPDINKIDNNYRKIIKDEISKRLKQIGYWDFIPIPLNF